MNSLINNSGCCVKKKINIVWFLLSYSKNNGDLLWDTTYICHATVRQWPTHGKELAHPHYMAVQHSCNFFLFKWWSKTDANSNWNLFCSYYERSFMHAYYTYTLHFNGHFPGEPGLALILLLHVPEMHIFLGQI